MAERHQGDLLRGAPRIADYLFKDPSRSREVYTLKYLLPLFKMGGVWCGRARSLDAALAEHERASVDAAGERDSSRKARSRSR